MYITYFMTVTRKLYATLNDKNSMVHEENTSYANPIDVACCMESIDRLELQDASTLEVVVPLSNFVSGSYERF